MRSLEKLDLSNNPMHSPIPNSIGNLQNLTILNLVNAEIHGSILAELGNCRNLRTVVLTFDSLTVSLLDTLADLSLFPFSAEQNQLIGTLPSWLGF